MAPIGQCHLSESPSLWHKRFGHINHRYVKTTTGYTDPTPRGCCAVCVQAKQTRRPGKTASTTTAPFDRIYVDLGGGQSALPQGISPSTTKTKYFLLITDDFSRFRWVRFLERKSDAIQCLSEFLTMVSTQYGKTVKFVRSDGGKEFDNKTLAAALRASGTIWEPTSAYAPEQNGVSERAQRTLFDTTRNTLMTLSVPEKYSPYALQSAIYVWNRTTTSKPCPYLSLNNSSPSVQHLRIFGCRAFAHNPFHKGKLQPRSDPMVLLGYEAENVYLLLNPETGRIVRRRDVVFDEDAFHTWDDTPAKVHKVTATNNVVTAVPQTPQSYAEASRSPQAPEWKVAMRQELTQLHAADTWSLVPLDSVPSSEKILQVSGYTV